jgi:hypothetical protein
MFRSGMSDEPESHRAQRFIDSAAKAVFLAALRRGARREDAADEAGFSLTGFYGARRRDPAFAAGWAEALEAPPAAGRRVHAYALRDRRRAGGACPERGRGEVRIASSNRRVYQRRRRRHVRFDARAQEIFLTHFASNCDTEAAAAAAGVSPSTVSYHVRNDPVFAAAYEEALRKGYVFLEDEMLRQRLAAQKRLRAAIALAGPTKRLLAEEGAEFDRTMKLLARHDRKPRRPERGFSEGGRRRKMTFDMAMVLLDKRLRGLGLK